MVRGGAARALERVPESPDVLAEAIDARLDLRIALIPLQRYHDALTIMREAEALATRLGDRPRLGWVLADLCARLRNVLGEHRQAVEVGRRALAIATERGNHALELEATYRTGQAYFALGDYGQAIELLSRSLSRAGESTERGPTFRLFASWSHAWLAMAFSNLGRFAEAMSARHGGGPDRGGGRPSVHRRGGAHRTRGRGARPRATSTTRSVRSSAGVALGREWKFQPWATLSRLGYAYALSGRLPDARRALEEVERSDTTLSSMGIGRAVQVAWLAERRTRSTDGSTTRRNAPRRRCLSRRPTGSAVQALNERISSAFRATVMSMANLGIRASFCLLGPPRGLWDPRLGTAVRLVGARNPVLDRVRIPARAAGPEPGR